MSSSQRPAQSTNAAVYRDEKPVGPIRLPQKEPTSFVKEFNRLYRETGLQLEVNQEQSDGEEAIDPGQID